MKTDLQKRYRAFAVGLSHIVSVALVTKKNRLETIKILKSKNFGATTFSEVALLWPTYFQYFFGQRILAARQILSIPLYTFMVSIVFFLTWIGYLYLFQNPTYSFTAPLPLAVQQGIIDFYTKGIVASIIIDCITIQLTKVSISRSKFVCETDLRD